MESNLFASRKVRFRPQSFFLWECSTANLDGSLRILHYTFAAIRRLVEGEEKLKSRIEQRKEDFLVVVYSRSCRMEW